MNMDELREKWRDRRWRKPYMTALLLAVLFLLDVFVLSGILGYFFGIAGTVLHELILAAVAVGVFVALKGKMKVIFPFRKPEWAKLIGTLMLWAGTYLLTLWITSIVTYLFPQQMSGASQGVNDLVMNMPVLLGVFVIALVPAVCEELAFRGALLGCFREGKHKWIGILVTGLFFGACHGSIWRMIPTALLGIVMGYILLETDNMIYNMLFHFVNNLFPVLLLGILRWVYTLMGQGWMLQSAMESTQIPFASVGLYMAMAGAAPFLLYIGNYLLHRGQPGYTGGMFPAEKNRQFMRMGAVTGGMVIIGGLIVCISIVVEAIVTIRFGY